MLCLWLSDWSRLSCRSLRRCSNCFSLYDRKEIQYERHKNRCTPVKVTNMLTNEFHIGRVNIMWKECTVVLVTTPCGHTTHSKIDVWEVTLIAMIVKMSTHCIHTLYTWWAKNMVRVLESRIYPNLYIRPNSPISCFAWVASAPAPSCFSLPPAPESWPAETLLWLRSSL